MNRRSFVLWSLFGVTAAATFVTYQSNDEPAEAAVVAKARQRPETGQVAQAASQAQPAEVAHVELERLTQQNPKEGSGKPVANAFNAHSWYVAPPPPPPPPPQAPPVPTAPPLPFSYLGKYQDQTRVVVMLANGSRLYTVSKGEVIDATYRVERITEGAVELIYLPLNISQSLSTAGGSDTRPQRPGFAERYGRQ